MKNVQFSALSRAFFDEFPDCKPNKVRGYSTAISGSFVAGIQWFSAWLQEKGVPAHACADEEAVMLIMKRIGTDEYNRRIKATRRPKTTPAHIVHALKELLPMLAAAPLSTTERKHMNDMHRSLVRMVAKRRENNARNTP